MKIDGTKMYHWWVVGDEGEVLGVPRQSKQNKSAVVKLMRQHMENLGMTPSAIVTGKGRPTVTAICIFSRAHGVIEENG